MKAVENISFFNGDIYHKRYLMLNFSQPYCYFYQKKSDNIHHRAHLHAELLSCTELEDNEVLFRVQGREEKRTKSLLRKISQSKIKTCQWNFAFQITFKDKAYELYAPTRKDRE